MRIATAGFGALALALLVPPGCAAWAESAPPDLGIERPQVFVLADTNGNECVELAEIATAMAWRFAALDRNHDPLLTRDELHDPDPGQFAKVDANGDGQLDFAEVMAAKANDVRAADGDGSGHGQPITGNVTPALLQQLRVAI